MDTPLRVLIVEDSQADAELPLHELRAGGFDPLWERVDTPEAMRETLEGQTWDVIISDYVMPRFSGPAALKMVREMGLDVPFIIVTGQVGEEAAVEVMKAGANDYVLKGNLKRVVPAIQRELRDAEVRRERKRTETERDHLLAELRKARDELEARVRARTAELEVANERLRTEIDERKRAEEELRESEERARRQLAEIETIYNTASIGLCVFDRDLRYVRINDRLAEINGIPAAEHVGRTPREVVPSLAPLVEGLAKRIFETGQGVSDVEFSGTTASQPGVQRTWVEQWMPLNDPSGQVMGINVSVVEVTEQRRMQAERERLLEQLAAERQRLETTLETVPVAVVVVEPEGRTVLANRSAEFLLGTSKEQIGVAPPPGYSFQRPTGEPYPVEELPLTRALNRGESLFGVDLLVTHPDGRTLHLLVNNVPVADDEGRIIGALASFVDVTPLREMERQREEFISIVAHDLRGAITSIRGYAEILVRTAAREAVPESIQRSLGVISSGTRRMERMVADLLDVSRIEARTLSLVKSIVDLPSLVQDIVARSEELTKGHPVKLDVHGEIPQVEADPDRVEQVLTNLLSNAEKYSYPETEITVEVERRGNEVMVSVTNLGRGVLREDREKLFTRFHRTQQAQDEKVPGLGLGLYIAKGLVEAHGGRIWVESEPGRYATFRFSLPVP